MKMFRTIRRISHDTLPGIMHKFTMSNADEPRSQTSQFLTVVNVALGVGVLVILIFAGSKASGGCRIATAFQAFSISMAISLAALLMGGLFGFLFSIPRSSAHHKEKAYHDNSNLVEISDWLTKILVGAGLVTLTKIPSKLAALAEWIGTRGFKSPEEGSVFALALMLFFGVCGFLWVYTWTRMYFTADLNNANERYHTAVLNTARENPVATLLLNALSLPPDDETPKSVALRKQAMGMAKAELSENPESRKIAIQYSRLLEEQFKDREGAINVLESTLRARRKAGIRFDNDDAAINYNLACYFNLTARNSTGQMVGELRGRALSLLREANACDNSIKQEMLQDPDLNDLGLS